MFIWGHYNWFIWWGRGMGMYNVCIYISMYKLIVIANRLYRSLCNIKYVFSNIYIFMYDTGTTISQVHTTLTTV